MRVRGAEPNYNVRGLPQVSSGPMANAEMFGGAASRQLMDLGKATQGLGQEIMRQDQVRRKEQDETQARISTNDMHKRIADQEKTLKDQYKGNESYKLPEEMAKLTKQIRDDITGKLQNQHQIDFFSRAADAIESRAQIEAFGWRDGQMEIARQNSLDGQNTMITQEGADNAAGALTPDGIAANRGRLAQIEDNIRQRHRGQSSEFIDVQIRSGRQTFHQAVMNAMERPADALKYLEREDVKEAMGPARVNELKKKYKTDSANNEINVLAMGMAEDPEMTSAEANRKAFEMFPDDPDKPENKTFRDKFINVFDDHRKRVDDGKKLEASKVVSGLTQKFMDADFSLDAMSVEDRKTILSNDKLYSAFTRHQKWLADSRDLSADRQWAYEKQQMQPSELREWLNQPKAEGEEFSNFEILMRKTAGDKELLNKVLSRSLAKDDTEKAGSAKFSAGRFLETSYGDLYKVSKYIFWEANDNYQDADTNKAKTRRNGWLQFYDAALAEKEKGLGRAATFEEQEETAFKLAEAVRSGKIDLDKPYWSQRTGDPDTAETIETGASILIDTLPFEKRRFNQGEPATSVSPGVGSPIQDFGNINPGNIRLLPPDIIDYKAKRVLRAYSPGSIGGREYAAGDFIVYGQNSEIVFFSADGTMKGNPITSALPRDMESVRVAEEEKTALRNIVGINQAEQNLNTLRNRKKELERSYEDTFGFRIREREERISRGEKIPRNNQYDMARLQHQRRMNEINREIEDAENMLRRARGE